MSKFKVGQKYTWEAFSNHNSIWDFEIVDRTEKTVTLKDEFGRLIKRRILKSDFSDDEEIRPLGKFSGFLVAHDD